MATKNQDSTKNVMLLGKTGAGKSLLGSVLLNDYEIFEAGNSTFSWTKDTSSMTTKDGSYKIFDTKGFMDTADEILKQDGCPEKMVFNALKTVGTIADEGVHALLLVMKCERIGAEDGKLAKDVLARLFNFDVRDHVILVITNCEDNLVDNPEEGFKWIRENAKNKGSNFGKFFSLVKNERRVVFVNNRNPKTVSHLVIFFC